ncbi:MAG: AAA family ATPase [Selenomonas sp.]|nr:AAA family ATPase [Veillonellaceae bacterium]MDY6350523.1 AAA family ATPase [Selenomonas sp.]
MTILPESLQGAFGRRYVTALLAKPFVILTGNSGTGKTRIARRLAKVLACDVDGGTNSLVVPVGADWTDNTKLLGFFNPLAENGKGHYVKTQVLELLERAHHHPELPFFLILDEMNLSHVERYFADFLSHMEMPGSVMKLDGYGELPFPRNLFVTGTVNIDETTYMFSPKVLDRANVVEFVPEKASVLDSFEEAEEREAPLAPNIEAAVAFCKMAEDVRNGRTACQTEDVESAKQVFGAVYDVLPHGMEFAYRTVKEVRRYLAAARAIDESFDKEKCMTAIDEQLLQKVLPKIHGNKRTVGDLLARLAKLCGEQDSHSMEETGGAQFDLPKSRKKIQEMKKRLAAMQYVSFI